MNLNFDTGVKSYNVNGVEDAVRFNPADGVFLKKLCEAFKKLVASHEQFRPDTSGPDGQDAFDAAERLDLEARREMDGLFGEGTCAAIFDKASTCGSGGGLPAWMNFLLAVMDECNKSITEEQKKTSPALQKYLKKYGK